MNRNSCTNGSGKNVAEDFNSKKKCIWNKKVKGTQMEKFMQIINSKHETNFESYWELHEWSVKHYDKFWEEILIFFNIKYSGTYEEVARKGQSIIDVEWFGGARVNYAENVLRNRDERTALICLDEEGNEDIITFAEIYEEVKMYAAAFKKLGLKEGDMVACYMANRKEALYAMLGAVSLGGVWGGPLPYYGAQTAMRILEQMNPKFLITMDRFQENTVEINLLQNIPEMVNSLESLIKVVIVSTKPKTLSMDISNIKNSCFLKDFLDYGKDSSGCFPEIDFVQLPFNHPIFVNFTSGTTGLPKAILHSTCALLPYLRYSALHLDFTEKDAVFSLYPVGWTMWSKHIPNFILGSKLILYNGNPYFLSKTYFWDLLAKYKITYALIVTSFVEKMEKNGVIPEPTCNLENLRVIHIGGSPVQLKHIDFINQCVHHNSLFVCSAYGSTEILGGISGLCFDLPAYNSEMQAPLLGLDLKCYNSEGNSVIGQYGELVITNSCPDFPLRILNDQNNEKLYEIYLSKYKGVWCQHDECWMNPETKGFIVIGRSDDTLISYGSRFGPSDIYFAIYKIEELEDYLCVGQTSYRTCDFRCILFVKLKAGFSLNQELIKKISDQIESELTDEHVPEKILEVPDIPYNLNNKRLEALVKSIITKNEIPKTGNVKNPGCLKYFLNIPELQNY